MKRVFVIALLAGLAAILAASEPSVAAIPSPGLLIPTSTWATKVPMPSPRDSAAAVAFDGKVYVIGGTDSSGALASMLMYDPVANSWTGKANMPGAKSGPGAAVENGRIYVVGPPDSQLYEYNPATNSWATKSSLPVTPADKVALAAISGDIFATFPVTGDGHPQLYQYDPFQDAWQQRQSHPDNRSIASLGIANGMIYAIGGCLAGQSPCEPTRADRYDPMNNAWTTNAIPSLTNRRTHLGPTLPTVGGKMYVIGGWDGYSELSSVEVYDPWSNTWASEASMPTARYKAAYAAVGYKIYVIGGNQGGGSNNWLATNEELTLPQPSNTENPIAFISTRDGYYEIYSIMGDGTKEQRLTNDWCAEWHVAWTPRAERILFSVDCLGNFDIYSMNPDGSDWRRISSLPGNEWRPSMSPDGQTIAFGSGQPPNDWHIYLMNSDGTNVRQCTFGPGTEDDSELTWSPDSQHLIFRSTRSGNSQLWRINADCTSPTQLTNMSGEAFDPAWSPDGSTILFTSEGDLRFMDPDGTNIRTCPGPGWESRPAWSPDGTRIAYSSFRNGAPDDVYVMNRDCSGEQRLTTSPESDGDPAWAPPTPYCTSGSSSVDVMLVIDRSSSMSGTPLANEKVAAKGFVDRMNLTRDQVGLASFETSATLNRQLTHDGNSVKTAIDALVSGSSTNMSGGISTAQAELVSSRHNSAARPVMLLMSDGVPNSPSAALTAAQAANNAGTRIFTVGLGSVDANLMRQLASSPSDYYYAPTSADLAAIYQTIAGVISCSTAKVKIDPASKRAARGAGTFTMTVMAEDVTNLAAYQVDLIYTPTLVHVTGVTQGPFLGSTGRTVNQVTSTIDNTAGKVTFGAFTSGTQPGVNGTGVLATVSFQPQAVGTSTLHLQNLQVTDPNGVPISNTLTLDGQVQVIGCFGDFDGDGDVDIIDLQLAASHWNCHVGNTCYDARFDTEPDGDIDVFDLQRFAAAWGTTCSTAQALRLTGPTAPRALTADVGLKLVPSTLVSRPDNVFTLTVRIENATNVGAFQTDVVYDPGVAQVEGVTIGSFLGSTGRTVMPVSSTIDNTSGRVSFGAFTTGSQDGASDQGDLAYIRFKAHAAGQTTLSFQQTGVSDPQGNPLYLGGLEGNQVIVTTQPPVYLPIVMRGQ